MKASIPREEISGSRAALSPLADKAMAGVPDGKRTSSLRSAAEKACVR